MNREKFISATYIAIKNVLDVCKFGMEEKGFKMTDKKSVHDIARQLADEWVKTKVRGEPPVFIYNTYYNAYLVAFASRDDEVEALKQRTEDIQSDLLGEIHKLQSEVQQLKAQAEENESTKRLYHGLCHEWTETCADDCDSWGHSDGCKNVNIGEAKKALQSKLETVEAKLKITIEALEFYGQEVGIHNNEAHWFANDDGKRAREALAQINSESESND